MAGQPTVDEPAFGRPSPLVLNLVVAVLCMIWGSTWLVIREGLEDLPAFTSASARFALAGVAMIALAPVIRKREGGGAPPAWLWITVGAFNFTVSYAVVYWCEQTLPSGLVSVLWAVFPMMMAISGHLFLPGERLKGLQWLGFVAGFAGIVLLFRTDVSSFADGVVAGLVLLISPFVSVVGSTLVKRFGENSSSAILNRNAMLVAAACLGVLALFTERGQSVAWTGRAVFSVSYLALAGTVTTFGLYFWVLRHAPAHRLSLIAYVTPAIALALGWAVGDERVTLLTLGGAAFVLVGVLLVVRGHRTSGAKVATERSFR